MCREDCPFAEKADDKVRDDFLNHNDVSDEERFLTYSLPGESQKVFWCDICKKNYTEGGEVPCESLS